jgi:hypothetical protein
MLPPVIVELPGTFPLVVVSPFELVVAVDPFAARTTVTLVVPVPAVTCMTSVRDWIYVLFAGVYDADNVPVVPDVVVGAVAQVVENGTLVESNRPTSAIVCPEDEVIVATT